MVTTVAVMAAVCAAADATSKSVECHIYRDAAIRMAFPERLAGLSMTTRTTYMRGDDDYSLSYFSTEGGVKRDLSIYVYVRDGRPMPDGVNDAVSRQLDEADEIIKRHRLNVMSQGMTSEGHLKKCGVSYLWNSYLLKFADDDTVCSSFALVFVLRNRFVKLRYSEPAPDGMETPCEVLPQSMLKILSELDELVGASEIDVYGIADPTNRLAAIRAKWPHAADRVSQWEMPDYEENFQEIDRLQDWCSDAPASRYGKFEEACRDAIAMKIEPAIWFYNLACTLAVQGKPKREMFDALEQAVAAGYNKPDETMADKDFQLVTNDVRFAKLCETMGVIEESWNAPKTTLNADVGDVGLHEDNIYYVFNRHSYLCYLESTNACPIIYLNHHLDHQATPCDGLVTPRFPEAVVARRRHQRPANMHFLHLFMSALREKEQFCPTIMASDWMFDEDDRMVCSRSMPAAFGLESDFADNEGMHHIKWNNISICSAAWDYGVDGVDRFIGHFPLCIAYTGGADEADKFVRLCHGVIEAMPLEFQGSASVRALNIVRHAQKCVKSEETFMSGVAHRPVLRISDIDEARAVALARNTASATPVTPPIKESSMISRTTPCTDLWERSFNTSQLSASLFNHAYIARQAERTLSIRVAMCDPEDGELVWKVLQGNDDKVRIIPLSDDKSTVDIEVDWHNVFDAPLPDGTSVKSSRVDIGCFRVYGGVASIPAIVSVYFSPNETREYGADGKLVSIDYAKRQLDSFTPNWCVRGDWKDVFHWDRDGRLTGWTRYNTEWNGRVKTNEFTREGLMIDTRDALGRPKDVHRSMVSTWKQKLDLPDFTNETGHAKIGYFASQYDRKEDEPLETTLAWIYEYENDADRFGKPSPKAPAPFRYRPELCLRADFAENSGFRLPLMDQMRFGFYIHAGYRHDTTDWFNRGDELMRRDDSRIALEVKGLKQPDVLKKMKFCPWKPGTNDVWKLDYSELDGYLRTWLMELADGVYRLKYSDGGGERWSSVAGTYTFVNDMLEEGAYARLDKAFRRCSVDEVRAVGFHRGAWSDFQWDKIEIAADGHIKRDDIPDGKITLAMWQIAESVYLGVQGNVGTFRDRDYYFVTFDKVSGTATPLASFCQLPSRAIGNVVLAAEAGDANALNNLAVLCYAGIANSGRYEESAVLKLLKASALKGNATAMYNVGVLFENRGEMKKAKIAYDSARECERGITSPSNGDSAPH